MPLKLEQQSHVGDPTLRLRRPTQARKLERPYVQQQVLLSPLFRSVSNASVHQQVVCYVDINRTLSRVFILNLTLQLRLTLDTNVDILFSLLLYVKQVVSTFNVVCI